MKNIEKKLNIISKTYLVFGWLCVVASFVAPGVIISSILTNSTTPIRVKVVLAVIAILSLIISLLMSGCILFVARSIAKRRKWLFCVIVSAILCASVPVGTAIGIFALIVLTNPQAKEIFASS